MIGVGFFFFSSRRRHTRYWRDWSSDVCSSDLKAEGKAIPLFLETLLTPSRSRRKPKQKLFPFFFQTLLTARQAVRYDYEHASCESIGRKALFGTHQVSFDKVVDLAIHHSVHIRSLMIGAVILHPAVVEHVAPYLRSPLDLLLSRLYLCLLRHAVLQLLIVQDGAELAHSVLAVLRLVARLGIFNQDFFFLPGVRV